MSSVEHEEAYVECIECGSEKGIFKCDIEDVEFPYGFPNTITLVAKNVKVWKCSACKFEWMGASYERATALAVKEHEANVKR